VSLKIQFIVILFDSNSYDNDDDDYDANDNDDDLVVITNEMQLGNGIYYSLVH